MESLSTPAFVDDRGIPFDVRLQGALHHVRPQLRRHFPTVSDETIITEVLEEVGRRIRDHELNTGPVQNLSAYAWVSAQNVARSRLRRSSMRLVRGGLDGEQSQAVFEELVAVEGAPAQIESGIYERQILTGLTEDERILLELKTLGLSGREIGGRLGISVVSVNVRFHRLKRRLRRLLGQAGRAGAAGTRQPSDVPAT